MKFNQIWHSILTLMMYNMTIVTPKNRKWCPTNFDWISLLLSQVFSPKLWSASHAMHELLNYIAFWIQDISYNHWATWSMKQECHFCVVQAGCLAKLVRFWSPELASPFCGQPTNISMSLDICNISWNFCSLHPFDSLNEIYFLIALSIWWMALSILLMPFSVPSK